MQKICSLSQLKRLQPKPLIHQKTTKIMKRIFQALAAFFAAALLLTACKKDVKESRSDAISPEILGLIKKQGFGTSTAQKVEGGYLVEGDILLTEEHLRSTPRYEMLRVGTEEQYRTSNTVLGLPRIVTVRVSTTLGTSALDSFRYWVSTRDACNRYNAVVGLTLRFVIRPFRSTIASNITITAAPSGVSYLASAGFPTDQGNPFNIVRVNRPVLNGWAQVTRTTIMAHELGHCIGYRHTDWMARQFSCGGAPSNEGAADPPGAKWIPGTPTGPVAGSWMLACIGNGVNRPFIASDIAALRWLY